MGEIIKRTTQTVQEMEAEIAAEEKALAEGVQPKTMHAETETKEVVTLPPEQPPVQEAAPQVPESNVASEELQALKAQLSEVTAKNAELTKRIRDEDGRRGGEMGRLQNQVEALSNQLRDLIEENRKLAQSKPASTEPATPEPEPLAGYDDEVREGVKKLVQREGKVVSESVSKVEKLAEEAKHDAYMMRYERMMDKIKSAVPDFDEINASEDFIKWTESRIPGSTLARKATLEECAKTCRAEPVVELVNLWKSEQKAAQVPAAEPKGPAKPSKEAQVQVSSAAASPTAPASKPQVDTAAQIRMLEDKVYRLRNHTPEESKRLDALYEQLEREKAGQAA